MGARAQLSAFRHNRAKTMKQKSGVKEARGRSASELIDAKIRELGDWRGRTLSRLRTLIRQADPEVVEEWKWRGVPVWSHDGLICTGEVYKNVVKMTFSKGASLEDPSGLFNASRGAGRLRLRTRHAPGLAAARWGHALGPRLNRGARSAGGPQSALRNVRLKRRGPASGSTSSATGSTP